MEFLRLLLAVIFGIFRCDLSVRAENLMLRHQLDVLCRTNRRPRLERLDRLLWAFLFRRFSCWKQILAIVKPRTVMEWHRRGFLSYWRWKSRGRGPGRPPISAELRELIIRMLLDNRTWGTRRVQGELLKLGHRIGRTTIRRIMEEVRPHDPSASSNWRSFLKNQAEGIWACDMFVATTLSFRQLYVMIVIAHATRELVCIAVTDSPSTEWCQQAIREATPYDEHPKFLIHDNDARFGVRFQEAVRNMGIRPISTPFHAPLANAICERLVGTIRRECLDHVLVWNERHLQSIMIQFAAHYNRSRTHQGIDQQTPLGFVPPETPVPLDRVVTIPVLGGLHHEYRAAA